MGYTPEELMATVIAREVRDGETAAVGTLSPIPAAGVLLAHATHAPRATVIILNHEEYWPFTNGSKEFYDFAQRGRIDLFFLSGGQIDQYGNLNLFTIGPPENPLVRFPGGAGAAMLLFLAKRVIQFKAEHTPRTLVSRVEAVTSPGSSPPNVYRPGGPWKVITSLAVFAFDRDAGRLVLESLHPGVSSEALRQATGFPVEIPADLAVTPEPTEEELRLLRTTVRGQVAKLYPRFAARAFQG